MWTFTFTAIMITKEVRPEISINNVVSYLDVLQRSRSELSFQLADLSALPVLDRASGQVTALGMQVNPKHFKRVKDLPEIVDLFDSSFLMRKGKSPLELIEAYDDSLPLLRMRKAWWRVQR
jgi:hypothetical protein